MSCNQPSPDIYFPTSTGCLISFRRLIRWFRSKTIKRTSYCLDVFSVPGIFNWSTFQTYTCIHSQPGLTSTYTWTNTHTHARQAVDIIKCGARSGSPKYKSLCWLQLVLMAPHYVLTSYRIVCDWIVSCRGGGSGRGGGEDKGWQSPPPSPPPLSKLVLGWSCPATTLAASAHEWPMTVKKKIPPVSQKTTIESEQQQINLVWPNWYYYRPYIKFGTAATHEACRWW